MKKVLIGCPTFGIDPNPGRWLVSQNFAANDLVRAGYSVSYCYPYRKGVCDADNQIVKTALTNGYDYILRMDDDIWGVESGDVLKLLEADKEFISAVMFTARFPYALCACTKIDKSLTLNYISKNEGDFLSEVKGTGVQKVDLTATPFTLFKTSMFEKMTYPFFDKTKDGAPDSNLCDKCLAQGIQPYVHMDIQLNHREVTPWNRLHLFNAEARKMLATQSLDPTTHIFQKLAAMFGDDGLKDLLSLKGTEVK